jgi:hypothetical protein
VVLTLVGVRTVSLKFCPVRPISLCCVRTPANPLLLLV